MLPLKRWSLVVTVESIGEETRKNFPVFSVGP